LLNVLFLQLDNLKAAVKATGSQDLEENTRYDGAQGNPFLNYSQKNQRNQSAARGYV
jgi:hypothetical protein